MENKNYCIIFSFRSEDDGLVKYRISINHPYLEIDISKPNFIRTYENLTSEQINGMNRLVNAFRGHETDLLKKIDEIISSSTRMQ